MISEQLGRLIWEAQLIERCLMYSIIDQDFVMYQLLCIRYKALADFCSELSLNF